MVSARTKASSARDAWWSSTFTSSRSAGGAGVGDLVGRRVDADHLGALPASAIALCPAPQPRSRTRLPVERPEQPERVLPGDVGAVADHVGREVAARGTGDGEASGHAPQSARRARLRWCVSCRANLQHGVPDPVGPPGPRIAVGPLRAWPPTSGPSRSSTTGAGAPASPTRGVRCAEALDGELVWARAKHCCGRPGQRAGRAGRAGRARGRRPPRRRRAASVAVVRGRRGGGRALAGGRTHLSLDRTVASRAAADGARTPDHAPGPVRPVGDLNLAPPSVVAASPRRSATSCSTARSTINARTA